MNNQLAVVENYPLLAGGSVRQTLQENTGGDIRPSDLSRVKIPAGGGTQWMVPSLGGDEMVRELVGIIVDYKDTRAYWKSDNPSGGQQPDCRSDDMQHGIGDPGGECGRCPFNQFGSSTNGSGKACKERRIMYFLRENEFLPDLIQLPASSLKLIKQFFLRLVSKNVPFYGCIVKLTLKQQQSSSGVTFSVCTPEYVDSLSDADRSKVQQLREGMRPKKEMATSTDEETPF